MGVRTGAGCRGAGASGGASALTLSASSGTRCCTRSRTYMLECGRELRQTQSRRARTASARGCGTTRLGILRSRTCTQLRGRSGGAARCGGAALAPMPACAPGPCPHHTESEKQDRGHARSQLTPTLGLCTCPLTPPPRACRAGRGRAQEPHHTASSQLLPRPPLCAGSQGSRGRQGLRQQLSPPPQAAVPTRVPAEESRARAPAMAMGPQDDHAGPTHAWSEHGTPCLGRPLVTGTLGPRGAHLFLGLCVNSGQDARRRFLRSGCLSGGQGLGSHWRLSHARGPQEHSQERIS